ncbi:uncharacterized protein [Euphorbia lathyris]|uniref:uncharacterized protein isoform X2 n=1 Tax=Euphorbia lathyris TaxID=212925 RepID=UPI003313254A
MSCCSKFLRSRITSLKFVGTSWEDNQLGLVGFQPLNIGLPALQGAVFSTTDIPIVGRSFFGIPAALSSSRVYPRPALTFMWYFKVWPWMTGRRGPPCNITYIYNKVHPFFCFNLQFDVTFPAIPCSLLSLDAMDIIGEQDFDIKGNMKKKRFQIVRKIKGREGRRDRGQILPRKMRSLYQHLQKCSFCSFTSTPDKLSNKYYLGTTPDKFGELETGYDDDMVIL